MVKTKRPGTPGHVNLRMLAEHLKLSQTTVSLVLNNSPCREVHSSGDAETG